MKIPRSLKHDTLENAVEILSRSFMRDLFQGYFNRTHFGLQKSAPIRYEHNKQLFSALLARLKADGAFFLTTAETPSVTTVWHIDTIPKHAVPDKAETGVPQALHELFGSSMTRLQKVLPLESKVLHYVLAGNLKSEAGKYSKQKGLSFINKEMFAAAAHSGLPIIAEATCVNSRDMCLYLGFEQLDEMRLGQGNTDERGEAKEGGKGLPIYLLMKRP